MSSQRIFLAYLLSISYIFSGGNIVRAENTSANPLDAKIDRSDPVIPAGYGKRELSSFEKYRITKTINELDRAARIKLEQGEDAAFKLWYRRLKLSRALGSEAEIAALGNVGAIAWKENRGEDLRNIADRLIKIQDELTSQESLSPDLLSKFATAYQQIRYLDKAVNIYQQILVNSREQDDAIAERQNLAKLGELYLARFDDRQAAKIYRELLSSTDSQEPKLQTTYLDTLIDIYDRTSQTSKALTARKRLLKLYAKSQPDKLAALEIAIAGNYQSLNQSQKAIEAYERAFNTALSAQRFATASDALTQLGKLYRKTDSIDRAIATYLKLLKFQQQSDDRYGAIDTYDTLGKIHLDLGQKAQARQYFERGLKLAESLDYKVRYFRDRINLLRESNSVK